MDIKFTSTDPVVVEQFSPKPANKSVPGWYRDLGMWEKNQFPGEGWPTVKHCMPVQDMITSGYIITNPYDTIIEPFESQGITDYTTKSVVADYIKSHDHQQCPVTIGQYRRHYFKINQPWIVRTPPGYSCLFVQPFYHFEDRYTLLPSIVDTDLHDLEVSLPGYATTDKEFKLEVGQPLIQIIPFKRDEWTMSATREPGKRSPIESIVAGYRTLFHQKKSFK
jgi:hypothetical protein